MICETHKFNFFHAFPFFSMYLLSKYVFTLTVRLFSYSGKIFENNRAIIGNRLSHVFIFFISWGFQRNTVYELFEGSCHIRISYTECHVGQEFLKDLKIIFLFQHNM